MIIFELVSSRAVEFIMFIVLSVCTLLTTSFVEDFYVTIFLNYCYTSSLMSTKQLDYLIVFSYIFFFQINKLRYFVMLLK